MGDRASFPIVTLVEMAAIPADRQARFLAELPDILKSVRQIEAALPALAKAAKAEAKWPLRLLPVSVFEAALRLSMAGKAGGFDWIDDDKGIATVSLRWSAEDEPFFTQSESMREPRKEGRP